MVGLASCKVGESKLIRRQLHGSLNGWGTKFSACCVGLTPGSGQSGS